MAQLWLEPREGTSTLRLSRGIPQYEDLAGAFEVARHPDQLRVDRLHGARHPHRLRERFQRGGLGHDRQDDAVAIDAQAINELRLDHRGSDDDQAGAHDDDVCGAGEPCNASAGAPGPRRTRKEETNNQGQGDCTAHGFSHFLPGTF